MGWHVRHGGALARTSLIRVCLLNRFRATIRIRFLEFHVRLASRPLVAAAAGLTLLLGACGTGTNDHTEAASVDGRSIARDAVEDPVRDVLNHTGRLEGLDADERAELVEPLQRQVLSLLIQATVIENLAEELGTEPDEAAIEERFQADVESVGGEEELVDALAQQQLSLELYRDVLLPTQLRVEGLMDRFADDIEPVEQREARHILVETEEEAQEVLQQLAGGADFAELAEEFSTDPGSAARGGDLGPAPVGAYVGPFDEAVWNSDIGDIIGPVATDFGYHVIEVTGEATMSAEDMPPQERDQQTNAMLNELLTERFAELDIQISDRFGTWDAERGEVVPGDEVGGEADDG